LTSLQLAMLGYDMAWASFHVVEVMSSPKAHLKAVGYLGAVQSFDQETDVLMLTTNLLKKVSFILDDGVCAFIFCLRI
jgi:AP-3 complex subunit delta